jgi:formiminotetrahydrofolate cyclodeaminase
VADFCGRLGGTHPTPGGGSAAAGLGAVSAGLLGMVADVSLEKARKAGNVGLAEQAAAQLARISDETAALRDRFLELIDLDAAAYDKLKTSKTGSVYIEITKHPQEILAIAVRLLEISEELLDIFYKPTASDLAIAAKGALSCAEGAELTVLINLKMITDREFVEKTLLDTQNLLDRARKTAEIVYKNVREELLCHIKK